jgi:hypothetical protein
MSTLTPESIARWHDDHARSAITVEIHAWHEDAAALVRQLAAAAAPAPTAAPAADEPRVLERLRHAPDAVTVRCGCGVDRVLDLPEVRQVRALRDLEDAVRNWHPEGAHRVGCSICAALARLDEVRK